MITSLLESASLTCVLLGLVCGVVVLLRVRSGRLALRCALDFWLAAGLLRLALPSTPDQLLAVVGVIAVRQVTVRWGVA